MNISSELIKEAKEISDKVKADSKVIGATKKAAPDSAPYKDTEKKIQEGVKELTANTQEMVKVTEYSGAINFVSSTSINTVTGSIVNISDLGTINKSPSITNTTNVEINNAATSINYSDTIFSKSDRRVTVSNQELLSASDQHSVVNNTTSITSTSNKTAAVENHEVITAEQKQYSNTLISLAKESIFSGTQGTFNLVAQGDLTIGSGQSSKSTQAQASVELSDNDFNPEFNPIDIPQGGALGEGGVPQGITPQNGIPGAALGIGNVKILSSGNVSTVATGGVFTDADTSGTNAKKIGFLSIDLSSQATTTSINTKAQSSLTSDGITYTGGKNTGILISPGFILAGTGLAPLIPIIGELLPPIVIDIPELPEFPFGNLADFLAKCLPFASAIDLPTGSSNEGTTTPGNNDGEIIDEGDFRPAEPPPLEPAPEPPLVIPTTGPTEVIIEREPPTEDQPVQANENKDGSKQEPGAALGTIAKKTNRPVDATPKSTTKKDEEEKAFTSKQSVIEACKKGVLQKCYGNTPETNTNKLPNANVSNTQPSITPKESQDETVKAINNLQQSQVVPFFDKSFRDNINKNYSEFVRAAAIIDRLGLQTAPLPEYSKPVNDFITNPKIAEQVKTFLNTLRPTGKGGQQPPNIQDDVNPTSNPISFPGPTGTLTKTPPIQGQGLTDIQIWAQGVSNLAKSSIPPTTDNWYDPASIDEDFADYDLEFGDQLTDNFELSSISDALNNKYVDIIKGFIPDAKIQSALSLTQDIAAGKITTPEEYASRIAGLVGGDVAGYIGYAQQAFDIYKQVESGNYSALLGIPGISNVLGSQGTAIASKVLGLIGKNNVTDKDIYEIAGSIFTALTGIGIPLLDELAKLLGCIGSLKQQEPFLQDISDPDLQDIIDFLPRIIQTLPPNRRQVLNITPNNCNQVSDLSAEEASINVTEIGQGYIKFNLSNKDLIKFNGNPLPAVGTPVNLYCEFYTDRLNNNVLLPYKIGSQFTSNILEYTISSKTNNEYTALQNNPNIVLTLEDNIIGSLFEYTSNDIGNRLQPFILDSYILL